MTLITAARLGDAERQGAASSPVTERRLRLVGRLRRFMTGSPCGKALKCMPGWCIVGFDIDTLCAPRSRTVSARGTAPVAAATLNTPFDALQPRLSEGIA